MKWLLLSSLFLAAIVSGAASWHAVQTDRERSAKPTAGQPEESSRHEVQGIGYVEPASEVRRLMLRTGGVIRSCSVQASDFVRKGELLLELDNSTHHADVELSDPGARCGASVPVRMGL